MARLRYTKEIAQKVREIKPPYPGISFDIIDRKEYVSIRIREDILMNLSDEKQVGAMEYLFKVKLLIESYGITCDVEGLKYRGN